MRISNIVVITIVIISLATIAAAQKTTSGIYTAYLKSSDVPLPSAGSTKVDASKVKFLPRFCNARYPQYQTRILDKIIIGIVARDVDLSDDSTAQQILQMGITFGQESVKCDDKLELELERKSWNGNFRKLEVSVTLYPGDPTTFTADNIEKIVSDHYAKTTWDTKADVVSGYWNEDKPGLILQYSNTPKALKLSLAYDAQEARKRADALEQQRQAEKLRNDQIAARVSAFVKKNGVKRFVTIQELTANPFIYKGQVVALFGIFEQMTSETQGTFSSFNNNIFVVSGIPTARFTQRKSLVILAVRVLGNIEVGSTLVPHLSLVGSAFCQEQGCRDYIQ